MSYESERKRQLQCEIDWLKDKIKTVRKPKHRKDLLRQLKKTEYDLSLGIFPR